jgi:hypothetical protein
LSRKVLGKRTGAVKPAGKPGFPWIAWDKSLRTLTFVQLPAQRGGMNILPHRWATIRPASNLRIRCINRTRRNIAMRIATYLAATAVIFAVGGAAQASEATTTGEIQAIGPHSITLFDGKTYELARSVDTSKIKRDWDYDITYVVAHGRRLATSVSAHPEWPQGSTF